MSLAKTKTLISCAVTVSVFMHIQKSQFSHDVVDTSC